MHTKNLTSTVAQTIRDGRSVLLLAFLLIFGLTITPTVGHAQSTWDIITTPDGTITEGSGTWAVGTNTWTIDGGVNNTTFANGDVVIFGANAAGSTGTAGTLTLGGNITTAYADGGLTFNLANAGSYTIDLNGFTLTPGGDNFRPMRVGPLSGESATVTINDTAGGGSYVTGVTTQAWSHDITGSVTINARITDADGLGNTTNGRIFTAGAGNLTLTNTANDFTGYVGKQNGGNLNVSSIANTGVASAAGAGNEVGIGFNARLRYTGTGDTTNRMFRAFGNNATIDNDGTGALIWTGAINNTMNANQTLTLTGNFAGGANEIQSVIGNSASDTTGTNLAVQDQGTWALSGVNTYSGTTTVSNNATLKIDGAGQLGSGSYANTITLNNTSALHYSSTADQTMSGVISGNGALIKGNSGTLTLSGANTYSGVTTINGGNLDMTNNNALGTTAGTTSINGGKLRLHGVTTSEPITVDAWSGGGGITGSSGNSTLNGTVTLNSAPLDVRGNNLRWSGGITSSTHQSISFNGSNHVIDTNPTTIGNGTVTITSAGSNKSNATQLNVGGNNWGLTSINFGGYLLLGGTDFIPTASSLRFGWTTPGSSSGVLDINGVDQTVSQLQTYEDSSDHRGDHLITDTAGSGTLTVDQATNTVYQGRFDNSISFAKSGSGMLTLENLTPSDHSFSNVTVNGGTLKFLADSSLNPVGIRMESIPNNLTINNGATVIFEDTANDNRQTHVSDIITFGPAGGGTLDYAEGNYLFQGTTVLGTDDKYITTGGSKNTITSSGGAFLNMQGANRIEFNVADGVDPIDLEVGISVDSGRILKTGAGTLALTNPSNLLFNAVLPPSGPIQIDAGILEIADSGRLQSGTYDQSIVNNGTFKYSSDEPQTLSGDISGTGSIEKTGTGTLTLSGNNSYTGSLIANIGTTTISNAAALGDPSSIHIESGAVLTFQTGGANFDASGATDATTTYTGTGQLNVTGGGDLILGKGTTISPGNSPGIFTIDAGGGSVAWTGAAPPVGPAAIYEWELFDATGTTAGTDWDQIRITNGDLDLTGLGVGAGIINVTGLNGISGLDISVAGNTSALIPILTANSITFPGGVFDPAAFDINAGNLASYGVFSISASPTQIFLQFTSTVPEPGTWALFGLLTCSVAYGMRRRRIS